jgi:hypothetical protein
MQFVENGKKKMAEEVTKEMEKKSVFSEANAT